MFMLQEGRTCDWETFPGREELRIQLARCSESLKIEETIKKKETIRSKYDVPIPDHNTLWGPVFADMVSQYGSRRFDKIGTTFLRKNSFPIGGRIEASILNLSQSRRGNKSERRRRSGGSKRQKD